jgi:hypothetical protein
MADQLKKVVTTKLAKELDLKGKSGQALQDAVLDVGHTGKPDEARKRAFDLLSQHLDTQGKVPITIRSDSSGFPRVDVAGLDPAKTQMLKDRLEFDDKFFDKAVDELAKSKGKPVQILQDVDPQFQRGLIPEDLDFYTRNEFSDPKKSYISPKVDAWFQRTQQNGTAGEIGKNILGSFFGRGYNEKFQNLMRSPNWELPILGGNKASNLVSRGIAQVADKGISAGSAIAGGLGLLGVRLQKNSIEQQQAQNDILGKNAVVAAQEKSLRQGLGEGHVSSADWSDRESTHQYIKNSKYANRWVLEDSFSDVIKSNYGGKLKRLYESDATEALQNLRRAYSERVKGLPQGKIAIFDDKGNPILGEKGKDNREVVDLKKFEQGIETEGGVFVPVEDRSSQDMENRGLLAEDNNRYVAMLYVPSKQTRKTLTEGKSAIKDKEAEGKPVSKVKTRAEIAAELDKGKSEDEPAAQWVFVDVAKKGTDAIYRDAEGNPAKPKFK